MNIHFLFFHGCPNATTGRENLREALKETHLNLKWREVDLEADDCPTEWRGFPSPTILVDGRDILTGKKEMKGNIGCRIGGAPSVEQIQTKLTEIKRGKS